MLAISLFGLKDRVHFDSIDVLDREIRIAAHLIGKASRCPDCRYRSRRIHSRYIRTVKDLPISGKNVSLQIRVRRFICVNANCSRKTFVEDVASFVDSHSRCSRRLFESDQQIGLALGGEAGSRLAKRLGIAVSGDTLLRRLNCLASKPILDLRVVGVDDWALRKGQRYGTLICDLERKCPIAILPTRSACELAQWLALHPEIEIVSRDRGGEYAKAAACGAPQATQIADRWHLLCNASHALLQTVEANLSKVNECLKDVSQIDQATPTQTDTRTAVQSNCVKDAIADPPRRSSPVSRRRLRYEQVIALKQQGKSIREIAKLTGISRGAVRRFYQADVFPERILRSRTGRISPYRETIMCLWHEGVQTARSIHAKLIEKGFKGSYFMVVRHLRRNKPDFESQSPQPARRCLVRTPRSITWLFTRARDELSELEHDQVRQIEKGCSEVKDASEIVRDFSAMVRNRDCLRWEKWLERATASTVPPAIRRFASTSKKDAAAIKAALSLPWSNGQLEGQINKLKMIKRQMYGRANLKLLEHRLLCVA
jgi:transposase